MDQNEPTEKLRNMHRGERRDCQKKKEHYTILERARLRKRKK